MLIRELITREPRHRVSNRNSFTSNSVQSMFELCDQKVPLIVLP